MHPQAPGENPRKRGVPWRALACLWAVLGSVASLAPLLDAPVLSPAAFALLGLGTVVALFGGPVLHRPATRAPWLLMSVGCAAFLVGALLRPWAVTQVGARQGMADVFTLSGYLLTGTGLLLLLPARQTLAARHALIDALTVWLAAASLTVTFLVLPVASTPGRPLWQTVLAAGYPLVDVFLVLLLLQLTLTTAVREASFRLLASALIALLLGDLGYAVIATQGQLVGPAWMNVPFAASYALLGAAALHPSMTALSDAQAMTVQAWTSRRLAVLLPALAVPPLLLALHPPQHPLLRLTFGLACLAMIGMLVLRANGAVRDFARSEERFRFQATHDPLTGLPNRAHLVETLQHDLRVAKARNHTLAVLFIDLDGFKLVNDSWGHDVGDELLVLAARRLTALLRPGDLGARIGGDEFVLVRPLSDPDAQARQLGEEILASFADPFPLSQASPIITPSLGLALAGARSTAESLIRDADTAMYRAKAEGRNQLVAFHSSMHDSVRSRVELELALRHAVHGSGLELHYQPVVALHDGRVAGFEALVRWEHPVLGTVRPSEFVPLAEDSGLIIPIGEWVTRTAIAQLVEWRSNPPVPGAEEWTVSINVSARQLRDDRFPQVLVEALAAHDLPPDALRLELTETAMVNDVATTRAVLRRLRQIGVVLSVDDFGTGYSSLGYLRDFPVQEVKIDRSFVKGLGRDVDAEELVRAVVAMAQALGLSLVAEGVEEEVQRDMLWELGVERAQGWLFGRPQPAAYVSTMAEPSTPPPTSEAEDGPRREMPLPAGLPHPRAPLTANPGPGHVSR